MRATPEIRGVRQGKLALGIDTLVVWENCSLMVVVVGPLPRVCGLGCFFYLNHAKNTSHSPVPFKQVEWGYRSDF